jgi:hypothetical protein
LNFRPGRNIVKGNFAFGNSIGFQYQIEDHFEIPIQGGEFISKTIQLSETIIYQLSILPSPCKTKKPGL